MDWFTCVLLTHGHGVLAWRAMAASPDPDLVLLQKWRDGDRLAGDQLLARHFKGIRSYFFVKFTLEHEDLVQETFARLIKNRDRFRGDSSFKTYLYRIAQHVGDEHLRRRYKLGDGFSPATSSLADLTGRRQSSILAERENHRLLLDALWNMPLAQQELIQLYYWQDLTAGEVAAIVELPETTVRSRIRLALGRLAKLHQQLSQQDHTREIHEDEVEQWLEALSTEVVRAKVRED